jgi:hypothetical protein
MSNNNYHVLYRDKQWVIERENAERASATFDNKEDALRRGKELAKKSGGELRIHGMDGKIQNSNSYGNDPNPPKDRKH